jgi:formate dehydrogenase subunit gamma
MTSVARPTKKPPASAPNADMRERILEVVDLWRGKPGSLLPILHGVQEALGHIPPDALAVIAHELNLTRAEVHGVVSFYHYFRTQLAGKHIVYLCRAEACQALGARALEAHAKKSLGIDFHETTPDGSITLEPVYCLGNCGCGPSVLIDTDGLHARVTPEAFDALVDGMRTAS